jgi:hypothetical protein
MQTKNSTFLPIKPLLQLCWKITAEKGSKTELRKRWRRKKERNKKEDRKENKAAFLTISCC